MKKIMFIILLISSIFTQDLQKIVHLNDGSQISGVVIEEAPGDYIKLYNDSSIKKINLIDIERISSVNNYTLQTSTPIAVSKMKQDISNKAWSITVGPNLGNFFTIKKEIKFLQNAGTHLSFGYPHAVGIGFSSESRYNQNGTKFSTLIGYNLLEADIDNGSVITTASSLAYQWEMGSSSSFLSLGLMLSSTTDEVMQILPVLSFDVRM